MKIENSLAMPYYYAFNPATYLKPIIICDKYLWQWETTQIYHQMISNKTKMYNAHVYRKR